MTRSTITFVSLLSILLFVASLVGGAPAPRAYAPVQDGLVQSAEELLPYAQGRVMVQFTDEGYRKSQLNVAMEKDARVPGNVTGLASVDAVARDAGIFQILKAHGPFIDRELAESLGAHRRFQFDLPLDADIPAIAALLESDPDVEYATPDWRLYPAYTPNDFSYMANWGHDNTGQLPGYDWGGSWDHTLPGVGLPGFDADTDLAWDAPQGFGSPAVIIAIIDTGVDIAHADLVQVPGYDFGDSDPNPHDDSLAAGHGTCCAGIAAATTDNVIVAAGVAGNCAIMPLKVADSGGNLFLSYATNALYYAANNGASVASMSFGTIGITSNPGMDAAISFAYSNNVTMLAASGNENMSTMGYPANHSKVIAVGAASPCGDRKRSSSVAGELSTGVLTDPNGYTCDGERWWGSTYGSTIQDAAGAIDVLAPTILPTTDITGTAGYQSGDFEPWFNGTSCATPYAAGVCALIISAGTGNTPAQVRAQLVSTATDVVSVESGPGWDRYSGYGLVNASLAVGGGLAAPGALFSAMPTNGCAPLMVNFTDTSTGAITNWNWDFGDGGMDIVQHPAYLYSVPGTYTVTLTVTGPGGSDTLVQTNMITVDPPTYSDFTTGTTSGPAPLTTVFVDATINTPTSWHWDFGDGGTSFSQFPLHTFTAPGLYTVTLTTSNACGGDFMTKVDYINVYFPPPVADFTASDTTGCAPLSVDFTFVDTGGPVDTWAWDFGDSGTSTQANPTHEYASAGTYSVTLIVTGPSVADTLTVTDMITVDPSVVASFSASDTTGLVPVTVDFTDLSSDATDWSWTFGDGGTSIAQNPSHEYTTAGNYTVRLIAANDCSVDTATLDVSYTTPGVLVAAFSGTPTSGCAPLEVTFTDASTGTITGWAWTFGDGGVSTYQNPVYTYNATGTYDVRLIVSGSSGSDTLATTGSIVVDVPPTADFSATPLVGADSQAVDFTDLSTGSPVSWSWNFGDAGTATTQNPSHTYTAPGRYTVTLTVGNGCDTDAMVKTDYIVIATTTEVEVPRRFALGQNYPNPFNPTTTIEFSLAVAGKARLEIFDASGRSTAVLVDAQMSAGPHQVTWQPAKGASGVYFAKFTANGETAMRRMVLIR